MVHLKPMKKIRISLCTFGVLMGLIFPIYADFFVNWIPEKKLLFNIGCIVAGYLVGLFSFYIVKKILSKIQNYYQKIIMENLGVEGVNNSNTETDLILNMQNDFRELIENYIFIVKKEKEKLRKMSITDCLTSGYNHRYLKEYFTRKISENCNQMTILFSDIDFFKKVNDTYGHIAGDLVLKEVGDIIKEVINNSGSYFRYGGEEFIAILDNCSPKESFAIAEDIRLGVSNSIKINECLNQGHITISIGMASYPSDGLDLETLIDKADMAMYYAKQNGRNKSVVYEPNIEKILKYNYN